MWEKAFCTFSVSLIVILISKPVNGLQCYECSYNKLSTGLSVVDEFANKIFSNEDCLLKDGDVSKLQAKTCLPPAEGKISVCAAMIGNITFTINFLLSVTYETVTRGCVEVDAGSQQATSNGDCYEEDQSSDTFTKLVSDYFSGLDISKYNGKICYYVQSLGSELYPEGINAESPNTLDCYACSYNRLIVGQNIIDQITSWISQVASERACLLTKEQDLYEIASKTCPEPSSEDKVSRCAFVKGNITFEIAGHTIIYETFSRVCTEVDKTSERAEAIGQCFPEDKQDDTLQIVVNNYFEGLQLSDFQGESCYYDSSVAWENTTVQTTYGNRAVAIYSQSKVVNVLAWLCICGLGITWPTWQ